MSPFFIITCIVAYFGLLLLIAWITGRNADNDAYFLGNKASPWIAVAFGMLADSLSGVTYISVPGAVGTAQFSYLQLVMGYVFGYFIIGAVLLPLYYKMNLTSIYSYLQSRFGAWSQKTGAFFFLLSRTLGAAARLYLTASVIQLFVFDALGVPFWLAVTIIIALMLAYTYKGGIKTLVWTDTLQSGFLLLAVVLSIVAISQELNLGFFDLIGTVADSTYSKTFFWDPKPTSFFFKQFLAGVFIAVAMTGLDQNMMQKSLSCKRLWDAQKNIYTYSLVMFIVNLFFLCLGVLLYVYANKMGIAIPETSDNLFPTLALEHLGIFAGLIFIVGLTAATFSSADSVLTTLTTSFYIDFMNMQARTDYTTAQKIRIRKRIHLAFAVVLLLVILVFRALNDDAIINTVLILAGYTYGPLLGLFAFGIFAKRKVIDKFVPAICIFAPLLCFFLHRNSGEWLNGYEIGNELILLNGMLTYLGLLSISKPAGERIPNAQAS
ncbi:MAG TPA: sodium:solute symporter [Anseongella sp.]